MLLHIWAHRACSVKSFASRADQEPAHPRLRGVQPEFTVSFGSSEDFPFTPRTHKNPPTAKTRSLRLLHIPVRNLQALVQT